MAQQLKQLNITRYIGIGAILLLILLTLTLIMLFPPIATEATSSDATITETNVNVGSTISVALQPSVDINIKPSSTTVYDKSTVQLTVDTNNNTGYSLYLQTIDNTTALKNNDLSIEQSIESITIPSILDNMPANSWGYSFNRASELNGNRIYNPIPSSTENLISTNFTTYHDVYDLSFGVAVGENLPVGRYSNKIVISAIANPKAITSLNQASYMQEMTAEACANTDIDMTRRLTDWRDGKKYWVAKLADGNCWMTQNLALTLAISEGEVKAEKIDHTLGESITVANTDISEPWSLDSKYPPEATTKTVVGSPTLQTAKSWDLGQYVWATPDDLKACTNQKGEDPYSKCLASGFINVSDATKWQAATEITEGWTGTLNNQVQTLAVNLNTDNTPSDGGTYDAHRLIGNLYTFPAATAGQGPLYTTVTKVESSICPKNWQLPTSGPNYDTSTDSFYNLFRAYGAELNAESSAKSLRAKPFYATPSGIISSYFSDLRGIGQSANLISSVAKDSTYNYYAIISTSSVQPSQSDDAGRRDGLIIRCIIAK